MADFNFGHIKRICESDTGHGMTKTALIHWVLGSIAEVERLKEELKDATERCRVLADTWGDGRKVAHAEGMEVAAMVFENVGESLFDRIVIQRRIRAAAKEQA